MKSRKMTIFLIIVITIIGLMIINYMVISIISKDKDYNIGFIAMGNKTKLLVQDEYNINEINNIEINVSSSNIKFVEGNENKIKVSIYGFEGEEYKVDEKEEKLSISKQRNKFYMISFFCFTKQEIVVEVPNTFEGDIGIKIKSGRVEMSDLNNANINISGHSGSIKCGNMKNGNIQASSGSIKVGEVKRIIGKVASRKYKS